MKKLQQDIMDTFARGLELSFPLPYEMSATLELVEIGLIELCPGYATAYRLTDKGREWVKELGK